MHLINYRFAIKTLDPTSLRTSCYVGRRDAVACRHFGCLYT